MQVKRLLPLLLSTVRAVQIRNNGGGEGEALQHATGEATRFWPLDQMFGRRMKPDYSDRQRLTPESALHLYQLLHFVQKIMDVQGIKCWAGAGTLLGAVRNKGVIPHDDDIDMQMMEDDLPKLLDPRVKKMLDKNDLVLYPKFKGLWGITNKTLKPTPLRYGVPLPEIMVKSEEPPYPYFVDIFTMKADGDELKYINDNPIYGKRAFPAAILDNLVKWPFGDSKVNGPSKKLVEPYLDKVYGKDWKTAVNCRGSLHGCKTAEDEDWALRHHAEPSGPLREPSLPAELTIRT